MLMWTNIYLWILIMVMIMFWRWLRWCLLIIMMMLVELLWWWCWWIIYMYMCIYVVGEFSYMLLVMTWWCKHVLNYVGFDCWSCVNICIVVVESYVNTSIFMLVTNTLYSIIWDDYDVQLASWGDDLRGDLVPHACYWWVLEDSGSYLCCLSIESWFRLWF